MKKMGDAGAEWGSEERMKQRRERAAAWATAQAAKSQSDASVSSSSAVVVKEEPSDDSQPPAARAGCFPSPDPSPRDIAGQGTGMAQSAQDFTRGAAILEKGSPIAPHVYGR